MPKASHSEDIYDFCRWMHSNDDKKKSEQFHQGQCDFRAEEETEVCRIQKFLYNLQRYLPKIVVFVVSPFGACYMVFGLLHYITNREEIFVGQLKKRFVLFCKAIKFQFR